MSFEDFVAEQGILNAEDEPVVKTPEEQEDPLAEIKAKMKELEERAVRAETRLEDMRVNVTAPPVREMAPPEMVEFDSEDLLSNPDAFRQKLDQWAENKTKPLVENMVQMRARMEMNDAVRRHPFLVDYPDEVRAQLGSASAMQLADPEVWNAVAVRIKDRHYDEIRERSRSREAPPETSRARNRGDGEGSKGRLTPEQRYHAKKLGLSDERYLKAMEEMNG